MSRVHAAFVQPGDMVELAKAHRAKVCTKNTDELFGLPR